MESKNFLFAVGGLVVGAAAGAAFASSSSSSSSSSPSLLPISKKMGFIGIGTINSACIRGLLKSDVTLRVTIGPRNAAKAEALRAEYPDRVDVAASNEEVVASSDLVFVATPPPPKGDPTATTYGAVRGTELKTKAS